MRGGGRGCSLHAHASMKRDLRKANVTIEISNALPALTAVYVDDEDSGCGVAVKLA